MSKADKICNQITSCIAALKEYFAIEIFFDAEFYRLLKITKKKFKQLDNLGIYNNYIEDLRDNMANAISNLAISNLIKLKNFELVENLLNLALQIFPSLSVKNSLESKLVLMKTMQKNLTIVEPIIDLLEKGRLDEAYDLVKSNKENYLFHLELELPKSFIDLKREYIVAISSEKLLIAISEFKHCPDDDYQFVEIEDLILDNLHYFNIDIELININRFDKIKSKITIENLDLINNEYMKIVKDVASKAFDNESEAIVFTNLMIAKAYCRIFGEPNYIIFSKYKSDKPSKILLHINMAVGIIIAIIFIVIFEKIGII